MVRHIVAAVMNNTRNFGHYKLNGDTGVFDDDLVITIHIQKLMQIGRILPPLITNRCRRRVA